MHPQPSPIFLHWSGITDIGKVRKNNEDTFLGVQFDAQEVRFLGKDGESSSGQADFVFAVSDGMGGALAGEFASKITVEKITRLMPRAYKQAAAGLQAGFEDVLEELFDQIHRALIYLGDKLSEQKLARIVDTMFIGLSGEAGAEASGVNTLKVAF